MGDAPGATRLSPKLRTSRFGQTGRATARRRAAHRLLAVAGIVVLLVPITAAAYLSTGPTFDKSWYWQNPVPQGNHLYATSFTSAEMGWAVGEDGTVLNTVNGGVIWQVQDPDSREDLRGVSFADASHGWTVGAGGTVRATADGGSTWAPQTSGTSADLSAVDFYDTNSGIAVGSAATALYTTDGGASWQAGTTGGASALTGVAMSSPTLGWTVGAGGTILKTTDGGASWSAQTSPTSVDLNAVTAAPGSQIAYAVGALNGAEATILKTSDGSTWAALDLPAGGNDLTGIACSDDGATVVAVGADGVIALSTDAGSSWAYRTQSQIAGMALRAVDVVDADNVRVVGDAGAILLTRDAGTAWTSSAPHSSADLRATWFVGADKGWAVGSAGVIQRTADGGRTWISQSTGTAAHRAVMFPDAGNGWIVGDEGAILRTANGGATWTAQDSGTPEQLNAVWFASETIGWVAGDGGTLLKTTDAGSTWSAKPSGTSQPLQALWFADADTGYAAGAQGTILKTTDAGETWNATSSGTSETLLAIHGDGSADVWAAGDAGTLLRSTDGGMGWSDLTSATGTSRPIRALRFASGNTGWFASDFGAVKKTTDGGANWSTQNTGLPTDTSEDNIAVRGLAFASGSVGYLVGDGGVIRRTSDGGSDWASAQYGSFAQINAMDFTDADNGWAVGQWGTLLRTTDSGASWFAEKTGTTAMLTGVAMTDANDGWIVGRGGVIRRTTNGGKTWTAQDSGTTQDLNAISAGDASHAVVGGPGSILYTANTGGTWSAAESLPTTQQVNGVFMVDAATGYAVTDYDSEVATETVFMTTDGGANWTAQPTPDSSSTLNGVYFLNTDTGYAAGAQGTVLKTTDGGSTWSKLDANAGTTNLLAIAFSDTDHGWVTGASGTILRTADAGATWTRQESGTLSRTLRAVQFTDVDHGWAAGDRGTMLRTTNQTPPTTTATIAPSSPNGQNGWYITQPAIALETESDATSWLNWLSAAGTFDPYTEPVLAPEGEHTLYYYSVSPGDIKESVKQEQFNTDLTIPLASTEITGSTQATSTLDVSWTAGSDAGSGVDHYDVFVDGDLAESTATTGTTLSGLIGNTTYAVTVVTVDAAGLLSSPSSPAFVTTADFDHSPYVTTSTVAPVAPDGSGGWYVTTATVTLSHEPSAEQAVTYYSWVSSAGPWDVYSSPLTAPEGANTLYYYSHDESGVRGDETVNSQPVWVDTSAMAAPADLGGIATGPSSVHLNWTPSAQTSSTIDHYDIYQDGLFLMSTTDPFADIVGLQSVWTYSYEVVAVNGGGTTSPHSAPVDVTTSDMGTPLAPEIVFAKAPAGDTVYVDWEPSRGATGTVSYRIWRSTDASTYAPVGTVDGLYNTTFADTGLASSTRYVYAVSAIDDRGEGSMSDISADNFWSIATTTTAAPAPAGLAAVESTGTVALSWQPSPNTGVVGYLVLRSDASQGQVTTLTPAPQVGLSYIDTSLTNGSSYWYSVVAVDASGVVSPRSAELIAQPHDEPAIGNPHDGEADTVGGCASCHFVHRESADALTPPGSQQRCLECHDGTTASDVKSAVEGSPVSAHPIVSAEASDSPQGSLYCASCHAPHKSPDATVGGMLNVNDVRSGDAVCYGCHGTDSTLDTGNLEMFEDSSHANVSAPATGSGVKCEACHETHSSENSSLLRYSGSQACASCHSTGSGSDVFATLASGDGAESRHDIMPADQAQQGSQMSCQNCHNSHSASPASPLVDPQSPSPQDAWSGTSTAFCLRCHSGSLPTDTQTQPWAQAPLAQGGSTATANIAATWASSVHGSGDGNANLRPEMGWQTGATLECSNCHAPHGSVNGNALSEDVASADGQSVQQGALAYKIADGSYDLRFFCGSCHALTADSHTAADISVFPTDCTTCHSHSESGGLF